MNLGIVHVRVRQIARYWGGHRQHGRRSRLLLLRRGMRAGRRGGGNRRGVGMQIDGGLGNILRCDIKRGRGGGIGQRQLLKMRSHNAATLAGQHWQRTRRGRGRKHGRADGLEALALLGAALLPLPGGGDTARTVDRAEAAGAVALVVELCARLARRVGDGVSRGVAARGARGGGGARGPFVARADLLGACGGAEAARAVGAGVRGGAALALARGRGREGRRVGGGHRHGGGRRREGRRVVRAVWRGVVEWRGRHGCAVGGTGSKTQHTLPP